MYKMKKSPNSRVNVGLISDTHIPTKAKNIPPKVFEIFKNVDFIIHAGDFVQIQVFDELEQIAPVFAVHGNMDISNIRKKLPTINSTIVFNWVIGVKHDPGALFEKDKMRVLAEKNNYNILVYGHTHRSSIKWEKDILFINPGSPTSPLLPFIEKPTVGMLRITEEKIEPEIIML